MSFASDYNFLDRLLHRVAFSNPLLQKVLAELEDDLFRRQIAETKSQREVFVTGLPRAGTTLILELLYGVGEFRTFTYRQMPFISAPILWNQISRPFQKTGAKMERAHGDGMKVSFDSPEAFEEVIWLAYMERKIVKEETLSTLEAGDYTVEFSNSIKKSIRKLLSLDGGLEQSSPSFRYLSKNNANISRIDIIRELFPSSTVLVPFRQPLAHVGSLIQQHERFKKEHSKDSFSKRYMKWLGHYEFGENFKPINFDGWLDNRVIPSQIDKNFWMEYWTAAYSYVINHKHANVHLVDFDELLSQGRAVLGKIGDCLGLQHTAKLLDAAGTLRSPTTHPINSSDCSAAIWNAAQCVHGQLKALAI